MMDEKNIMEEQKKVKSALESMMYVWGNPLEIKLAAEVLEQPVSYVRECMTELQKEYEERSGGVRIREINGKFQFCTLPENEAYIEKLCTPVHRKRLSNAAMEVLTIIAYRQPVARSTIDYIRGVKSDRTLESLQERGIVRECGRGTGLGRPILYGTTDLFLEKFGISNLDELPELDDLSLLASEEPEEAALSGESVD